MPHIEQPMYGSLHQAHSSSVHILQICFAAGAFLDTGQRSVDTACSQNPVVESQGGCSLTQPALLGTNAPLGPSFQQTRQIQRSAEGKLKQKSDETEARCSKAIQSLYRELLVVPIR